jgi:hypothetical protein
LNKAIGVVLNQKQNWKGKMVGRPLRLDSRKLHNMETRNLAYDRELLAIQKALGYWECYIQGNRHITIYINYFSIQYILK